MPGLKVIIPIIKCEWNYLSCTVEVGERKRNYIVHFTENVTTCPFKSIHACKWGHRVEIKALSVYCLGGKWYTLCRQHIQYIFNTYFALFFKLKLCFFLRTQLTIRHNCLGQSPATTNKPWPLPMMTQFTHICICITKPRWFHRTENVMAKCHGHVFCYNDDIMFVFVMQPNIFLFDQTTLIWLYNIKEMELTKQNYLCAHFMTVFQ